MHEYCFFSGMITRPGEAGISLLSLTSAAGFYGKGIFTTIAIRAAEPLLWAKHWNRLNAHAAKLGISLSHTEDATRNALARLIKENRVADGRARITFYDESPSPFWTTSGPRESLLLITTSDDRPVAERFSLGISPHLINSTSPLAAIKSCNYLEQIVSFGNAKRAAFDEAIRLNERGEITSACMANVFWTKDGRLFTPALQTGCLAGTTRGHVLENVECEEVQAGIAELDAAEQIFVTSAGLGVVPVAEFNGRKLLIQDHKILNLL